MGDLAAVFQYNKTDLPHLIPTEVLRRELNTGAVPDQEAVATQLHGTLETLSLVGQQVLQKLGPN
jgi:hypothetical protein